MMASNRSDLNMKGVGSASGGQFHNVNIEGVGRIDGSLRCETFRLQGVGTFRGDIISAGSLEIRGKVNGDGDMEGGRIFGEGQLSLGGKLKGEQVDLTGYIKVQGDCEAEKFAVDGGFQTEGLLNAGHIEIRLQGRGRAKEIGGERIRVEKSARKNWSRFFAWMVPVFQLRLTAHTIEGDEVDLEATTADVVRGGKVTIGPDCKIGHVEYRTELTVHPKASIGSQARIGFE